MYVLNINILELHVFYDLQNKTTLSPDVQA